MKVRNRIENRQTVARQNVWYCVGEGFLITMDKVWRFRQRIQMRVCYPISCCSKERINLPAHDDSRVLGHIDCLSSLYKSFPTLY